MRDFSWRYFTLTGDLDAFLLYREMNQLTAAETADEGQTDEEDFAAEAGGATGS
ncbi:YqzL-like protein [Paenibacillus sp. 32O-W]|jgi:hypothetical protein|uniref:YqzL family protein n=1 Tax=Paenibacillus sp. 32O-W TaxID=1695218 RepID=UPI000722266C|nr:YqzL family protein [Paenibacillus sp. 32O-W]ALS27305.1 YqzL-like protein [Paenibacillus sp. 32O-W]